MEEWMRDIQYAIPNRKDGQNIVAIPRSDSRNAIDVSVYYYIDKILIQRRIILRRWMWTIQ
jgi:hypothetical protein